MTINEAQKLNRGDRLKMTDDALSQGLDGARGISTGKFVRLTRNKKLICVQRDGYKNIDDIYHPKFWEKE